MHLILDCVELSLLMRLSESHGAVGLGAWCKDQGEQNSLLRQVLSCVCMVAALGASLPGTAMMVLNCVRVWKEDIVN